MLEGGAAEQGVVEPDVGGLEGGAHLLGRAALGSEPELLGRRVVLEDGAALGRRELDGVADDRLQDLFRVEARAHRLTDLAEGLELLHLGAQLLLSGFQRAHQLDVADGDGGVGGEGGQDLGVVLVEGVDLGAPRRDHADELVVEDHRDAEDRAVVTDLLDVPPAVVGVGEDVVDVEGSSIEADRGR